MLYIKDGYVMDPKSGLEQTMDIITKDDKIWKMGEHLDQTDFFKKLPQHEIQTIDADGCIVAPGLVDVHVHFRDPGFTEKEDIFTGLNDIEASDDITIVKVEKDEVQFAIQNLNPNQLAKLRIGGFAIEATKSCDPGDVAKLTISSKDFDSVTLEIAKMVSAIPLTA